MPNAVSNARQRPKLQSAHAKQAKKLKIRRQRLQESSVAFRLSALHPQNQAKPTNVQKCTKTSEKELSERLPL